MTTTNTTNPKTDATTNPDAIPPVAPQTEAKAPTSRGLPRGVIMISGLGDLLAQLGGPNGITAQAQMCAWFSDLTDAFLIACGVLDSPYTRDLPSKLTRDLGALSTLSFIMRLWHTFFTGSAAGNEDVKKAGPPTLYLSYLDALLAMPTLDPRVIALVRETRDAITTGLFDQQHVVTAIEARARGLFVEIEVHVNAERAAAKASAPKC